MRILIVAATESEIAPLVMGLVERPDNDPSKHPHKEPFEHCSRLKAYAYAGHDVDVLTTGVGMVSTAAWCSAALARATYDVGLNLGLCGSFDRALLPGTVVHVRSDRIAELGAEDGDAFLTIEELNLLDENEFPFTRGQLLNLAPPDNAALRRLRAVDGITVNAVHGNALSIAAVARRFAPHVESMEGAAFMYSCRIHGLAHAQIRAVSNVVEPRNRGAWKIAQAIHALGRTALDILEHA